MKISWRFKAALIAMAFVTGWLVVFTAAGSLSRRTLASVGVSRVITVNSNIGIDHGNVDAAAIPQSWLDVARQQVVYFNHRSIGNNILDGVADLVGQDPTRYTISVDYGHGTDAGLNHYMAGTNGDPMSKISGFSDLVQDGHHIAFIKFCVGDFPPFSDVPAADIWPAYRDAMESLQTQYPNTVIVWWTSPLTSAADGRGLEHFATFNALVRQYVAQNGGVLFDIADIESHDPDGNPITSGGYEAMYDGYSDDGFHLNGAGRQRVANALWWLLARIAGWSDATDSISITADADAMRIYAGQTATFTLSLTASEGFSAPVTLTLQDAPFGAIVSFDPNPVIPPGVSQLSITTLPSTAAGVYPMTVAGAAGQVTDNVSLTLAINSEIALGAEPNARIILPGDTAAYTLSVSTSVGFDGPVILALQGAPFDAIVSFDPNPVIPPGISQLYVTTTASTLAGTYAMSVTGASGEVTATTFLTLTLNPAAIQLSFSLSAQPNIQSMMPGEPAAYNLSVIPNGDFSAPVTLTLHGEPLNAMALFKPNPVVPSGTSHLYITSSASTLAGVYTMMVTGTSGAFTDTTGLSLIVVSESPSFTLHVSPTTRFAGPGRVVSFTANITQVGGYSRPVTLAVVGGLSDMDPIWSTNPVTSSGSSILTFFISDHPSFGEYVLKIVGVSETQAVVQDIRLVISYPFRVYLSTILK